MYLPSSQRQAKGRGQKVSAMSRHCHQGLSYRDIEERWYSTFQSVVLKVKGRVQNFIVVEHWNIDLTLKSVPVRLSTRYHDRGKPLNYKRHQFLVNQTLRRREGTLRSAMVKFIRLVLLSEDWEAFHEYWTQKLVLFHLMTQSYLFYFYLIEILLNDRSIDPCTGETVYLSCLMV